MRLTTGILSVLIFRTTGENLLISRADPSLGTGRSLSTQPVSAILVLLLSPFKAVS